MTYLKLKNTEVFSMPENNEIRTPKRRGRNAPEETNAGAAAAWPDISGVPTTPVAPPGGEPVWPDNDLAGVPTTPVAPPGGEPVWPGNTFPWPVPPVFPFPPSSPYSSQVRFLNASTNGQDLDVWIDGRNIFFRFHLRHCILLHPGVRRLPYRHCAPYQRPGPVPEDPILHFRGKGDHGAP